MAVRLRSGSCRIRPYALFKLVEVAEAAALTRLSSLEDSSDHHAEREALAEALAHLLLVKKDRLKFL